MIAHVVVWVLAVGAVGVYLWRAIAEAAPDGDGWLVVIFMAMQIGLATFVMAVNGFSVDVILLAIAGAHLGMLLGTWGHPVILYSQWRTPPRRIPIRQQLRVVGALLLVTGAGIALWHVFPE